jgi:hypothetical protein
MPMSECCQKQGYTHSNSRDEDIVDRRLRHCRLFLLLLCDVDMDVGASKYESSGREQQEDSAPVLNVVLI